MDSHFRGPVGTAQQGREETLDQHRHPLAAPWEGFKWEESLPASIWLIFCLFPIQSVLTSHLFPWAKFGAITLILAFAAFYIFMFGAHRYYPRGMKDSHRVSLYGAIFLTVLTVMWLTAGLATLSFISYFVGFLAFIFRRQFPRTALIITITAIIAAFTLGIALTHDSMEILLVFSLTVFSPIVVYLFSILQDRQEEKAILTQKLRVAEERERIAVDLHDLLGNSLTIIHLKSEVASRMLNRDPEKTAQEIDEIKKLARQSLSEVRAAVTRIQNPDLSGEIVASRRALDTANIAFHLTGEASIAGKNDALFAWIVREAVTNVIRHSRAQNCWVDIVEGKIQIQDDGVGWSEQGVETKKEGGLNGLRKRVQLAGGTLTVNTDPGCGTTLLVSMTSDRDWLREPAKTAIEDHTGDPNSHVFESTTVKEIRND